MDPFTLALLAVAAFVMVNRDSAGALMKAWHADRAKGNNEIGWWGREVGHGFPHYRTELGQGWRAHQASITQKRLAAAGAKSRHAPQMRQWNTELADHKRRMAEARKQTATQPSATQPVTQTDPPPLADGSTPGQPPVSQPATYPPDGPPPSQPCPDCGLKTFHRLDCPRRSRAATQPYGAPRQNGHDSMPCRDPKCQCHQTPAPPDGGAGAINGNGAPTVTTSTASGDTTYDQAHATIEKIKQFAESAVPPALVSAVATLADGLPAMIPDDSDTPSHVADSHAALVAAQAKAAEAIEHATKAGETLKKNFEAEHDAVQSTGHQSSRGFHEG